MKLSYNWLKDFVDLNDMTAHQVAEKLTMGAFEVEEVEKVGPDLRGPVVVGEIKEIYPHPNADKIRMTKTIVEAGGEALDIVCGAQNIEVGQKIPVALPGAVVLNRKTGEDLPIKASEIRGVKSNGMLCSPNELGITGGDSEGILILVDSKEKKYSIGENIVELLDLKPDWILHVEPRSNRGDALCVAGLAREVAAICDLELKKIMDTIDPRDLGDQFEDNKSFAVETEDTDDCEFFTLREIKNVDVKPSPQWLVRRLEDVGVRSVNNIVDITNYVMLETGQPLHAYDQAKLDGTLVARRAKPSEKLVLIDGKERAFTEEVLVIADQKKTLGVAGVMGGKDSEISDSTENICLEAAVFTPQRVRRASRLLGLSSDSSQRFERGVDIQTVEMASNRATYLINKYGSKEDSVKIGPMARAGKSEYQAKEITLRKSELKRLLDIALETNQIEKYLNSLAFVSVSKNEDSITVKVPSFRAQDVTREVDLVEEVARLYGYDNIPDTMPEKTIEPPEKDTLSSSIRNCLKGEGLSEAWISSLRGESEASSDSVRVLNPLSKDHQVLRQSLVPGLVQSAKYNIDHGNKSIWLFEVGRGYKVQSDSNGSGESDTGAQEYELVAGVISGSQIIQTSVGFTKGDQKINQSKMSEEVDFFRMKGIVENLLEYLKVSSDDVDFEKLENPPAYLHPYRCCAVKVSTWQKTDKSEKKNKKKGKKPEILAGWLGELHPRELNKLGLKQPVFTFELFIDQLAGAISTSPFVEPPQTPCIQRDLTVDLAMNVEQSDVIGIIKKSGGKNLEKVDLVSIFELSESVKSLSYRLIFQDKEETLQAQEIDKKLNKIRNTLTYQLEANFRA